MNNFTEDFYKILINQENFYIKQYYSNFHKKEIYFAVKELEDGIYCVLISNDESEDVDYSEIITYIKTLEKAFSLNMIVLSNKEYIHKETLSMVNKLVINKQNHTVIKCDQLCIPLKQIFEVIVKEDNRKIMNSKDKFFTNKVPTLVIILINIIMFIITQIVIYKISNVEVNNILNMYSNSTKSQKEINTIINEAVNSINNKVLIDFGALSKVLIEQGQIWRLLTCAFLHSGLVHIACNMYSLYIIGPQIQQIFGESKYLIIYIISCITSSLLSYFMHTYGISVGASGGIFGLMGALLVFAIIKRHKIQKRYLSSLIQIIIINLFIGLSIENIDNFGHIGGLLGGVLIGYISYRVQKKKENIYN
jgi:rhomboid protease GluP